MKLQVVLDEESDVVVGLFFQDSQMISTFDRFPEVILIDAIKQTTERCLLLGPKRR